MSVDIVNQDRRERKSSKESTPIKGIKSDDRINNELNYVIISNTTLYVFD